MKISKKIRYSLRSLRLSIKFFLIKINILKDSILELFGYNLDTNKFLDKSIHMSFYNISSVKLLLIGCGFINFNICSYGNSNFGEFLTTLENDKAGFDNPDTQDISLYIEVTK